LPPIYGFPTRCRHTHRSSFTRRRLRQYCAYISEHILESVRPHFRLIARWKRASTRHYLSNVHMLWIRKEYNGMPYYVLTAYLMR
jgi:hypothetical protein